jgi:hypothetical protein
MPFDKNRLILDIPNIAYGDPSLIGPDEWERLKSEFPDSYKAAQAQIKAHAEKYPPKGTAATTDQKPAPVSSAPVEGK